jgi:CRP-like cAMP-binding protein
VRSAPATKSDDLLLRLQRALPGCRQATYRRLVDTARIEAVDRDALIFRQGGTIPLILFTRGFGAFRRMTVDGQLLVVGIADPGALYGISSIASTRASVDLVAITDVEIVRWHGKEIRHLAMSDAGLALVAIDMLASFLTIITEKLDGFLHQDARRRVIRVLARHRDLFFSQPAVLSRSHLPSLVGTSREMTGRVLRQLEAERVIARVGRSGLALLRPDLLEGGAPYVPGDTS